MERLRSRGSPKRVLVAGWQRSWDSCNSCHPRRRWDGAAGEAEEAKPGSMTKTTAKGEMARSGVARCRGSSSSALQADPECEMGVDGCWCR